jgi:hypothetical protein
MTDPGVGKVEQDRLTGRVFANFPDELDVRTRAPNRSRDRNRQAGGSRIRAGVDPMRIANDDHAPKRNRDAGGESAGSDPRLDDRRGGYALLHVAPIGNHQRRPEEVERVNSNERRQGSRADETRQLGQAGERCEQVHSPTDRDEPQD